MAVQQLNEIDAIGRRKTGEVVLIIRESTNWQDPKLAGLLKRKIDTYKSFAGSDLFQSKFGDSPYQIALSTRYRPTAQVKTVLDAAGVKVLSD